MSPGTWEAIRSGGVLAAQDGQVVYRVNRRSSSHFRARFTVRLRSSSSGERRARDLRGESGWSIVSPIEELDGPPPLSDDAVEDLKSVFADHVKRKHGVAFDVTMEQKQRQPRVIAKHDVPS
jgi:hypothetical protein